MNLVTCSEDCKYQEEGYCKLKDNRVINATIEHGCCYYQKRKPKKKSTKNLQQE